MIPPAVATLHQLATLWPALLELRTSRPHDAWPPQSLQTYQRTAEEYDPMDRSAPVRLHILDTVCDVEQLLIDCADQTAAQIQRPAISHALRHWPRADRELRDHLADQDAADPRRWRYVGTRSAPAAAEWLARRLLGDPGPFTTLNAAQADHIERTATAALNHVQHALGTVRRTVLIAGRRCSCTGLLELHGGDGQPPLVRCSSCGHTRTGDAIRRCRSSSTKSQPDQP